MDGSLNGKNTTPKPVSRNAAKLAWAAAPGCAVHDKPVDRVNGASAPRGPARSASKVRVFLVDDHPIVRRGFQLLIGLQKDLCVCGEADSAPGALTAIQKEHPDVAIVDLGLKNSSGLTLLKQLRSSCPAVKVLVFTMHDEPLYAERVLKAGAHGYLTKEEGADQAIECVRKIARGKTCVSTKIQERMIEAMIGFSKREADGTVGSLSDREMQVLQLIGSGLGSREIAQRLFVSIKTIESHREHIKTKLGLRRAPELVQYAYNWVLNERPL